MVAPCPVIPKASGGAESTSAPTHAPVSAPVSDVEGAPAFCEKYCHEDDHWCMRKAGRQCRTALRTPHGLPGEEELARVALRAIREAREWRGPLKGKYNDVGTALLVARAILSRLTASREDGKNG